MKLSVYGTTPAWLAGVFSLIPALWPLVVAISLYSFYLIYLGIPVLMKVPPERTMSYTVALTLVSIVLILLVAIVPIMILLLAVRFSGV